MTRTLMNRLRTRYHTRFRHKYWFSTELRHVTISFGEHPTWQPIVCCLILYFLMLLSSLSITLNNRG